MKARFLCVIQLALSLVLLMAVVVGCAESPQTSKYPATLSGRVTISEKMRLAGSSILIPAINQSYVFWIVDISVKNVSYSQPIAHEESSSWLTEWQIVSNNVSYSLSFMPVCDPGTFNIPQGQSGQLTLVFSVAGTVAVEDAQICYKGQEPSSFGELSEKNTVLVYDWSTKSVINVTPSPTIETYLVHGASMIDVFRYMQLKTIASWQGTSSKTISFTATQVPCIINYGWTATSAISSSVYVLACDKNNICPLPFGKKGIWTIELDTAGKYTIQVDAVGAQWWVKIGVEQ